MYFIVTAYDGKDSEAPARRSSAREAHLAGIRKLAKERRHLFGAALLDDEENMVGSVLVVDYPSKKTLINEWLDNEAYVTGNVWQKIDIKPCRVPDFFLDTSLA